MEFKVGDLVYVNKSYDDYEFNEAPTSRVCKVIAIDHIPYHQDIGLEFFDDIDGHSCQGIGSMGYCWNIHRKHLRKITTNNKPLTIKYPYGIMYI